MTSSDSPGDLRTVQRPADTIYYGEPVPDAEPPGIQEPYPDPYRQPEPVASLVDPKVALALAGVAMLVGFALATLLFGVILDSDDSESIAGTGVAGAPTIADGQEAEAVNPLAARGANTDASPRPLNSEESGALVIPEAGPAMAESTTSITVASTTIPTSTAAPVTEVATTVVAPTTVPTTQATAAQTSATTMPATSATSMVDTVADTQAPGPSGGDAGVQQQVLDLTNIERAKAGCQAVILDPILNSAADAHSEDMAANSYFDHTGLDGSQPWDRVQAAGYPARGSGENIAQGYRTAADVVAGWMSSPGHRRNMLNCDWTEMGVGHAEGSASRGNIPPLYWTQVFATRR